MITIENETPRAELSAAKRALLELRLHGAFKGSLKSQLIPRQPSGTKAPLSHAQQRLWFFQQLDPDSALYNLPVAVLLGGRLDEEALRRAIVMVGQRHEMLRTRFESDEGNPTQIAMSAETTPIAMSVVNFSGRTRGYRDAEVQRFLQEEAKRPFDLSAGPLWRAVLVRLGSEEHILLITLHHIAADGWSCGVLLNELAALYRDFCSGRNPSLAELPIQYADYAVWQRERLQGERLEPQLNYWKTQLAGAPEVLELPTDRPRPSTQTFRGQWRAQELPSALGQRLQELSRSEGATLFMTLLAAFQTLLYRYTRQTDIIVGTPVAGRMQRETEDLIGVLINTLPLRGNLSGNPTFRELLGRVRELTLAAFTHQELPFEKLVEELRPERSPSYSPLVQVMFVLQNAPAPDWQFADLTMTPLPLATATAKFDLTLAVEEGPQGLAVAIEYNSDLFDDATIHRMLEHWQVLLEGIASDPDQRIGDLPLLTETERKRLLVEWNGTSTDYPREKTIHELFAEQARQTPEAIAASFVDGVLTYSELDLRSNRLAHYLRGCGVSANGLVGVCLERSPEMLVALLGILKAGGAYMFLDASYPKERLALMIEDACPPVILTTTAFEARLPSNTRLLRFDGAEFAAVAEAPESPPIEATKPSDLAYVSFTSGSTGRPKGVCVPHRGVVRLVRDTSYARFAADEVFLQLAPIAFDASTFEIWGALLNGARLAVFPAQMPTLAALGEFVQRQGVTTLWLTAGLFHQVIDERWESLHGVRQLLAGGDVLSPLQVRKALERLPGCRIINGYGPTENTTFTCCHRITVESLQRSSIPIGRPISNTTVYILDERLQPVPIGVPGELYTGGDGLARGYLNRAELTAGKFVSHPFLSDPDARLYRTGDLARWMSDGRIEFLGRIDLQVKIRGFRIELDEIETVLSRHPAVRSCAVVVQPRRDAEKKLLACMTLNEKPGPSAKDLRRFLADKLPDYMVPTGFTFLDELPLDPNGKVDRRRLASTASAQPERVRTLPRDGVERRLVKIWEDILDVRPIGVTDGFFELGGHSLLAVRLLARIESVFERKLPLAAIFQAATIEELAGVLRGNTATWDATSLVEIKAGAERPPLFLVHGVGGGMFWGYANLARHLDAEQPIQAFKSRGLDGKEEYPSIAEMAKHYVADLKAFQPTGPYAIGGYCFGGNVAQEMACQLEAKGDEVALVLLMNCSPTGGSYGRGRLTVNWTICFFKNLAGLVINLYQAGPEARRNFLRWKWRTWTKRLRRLSSRGGRFRTGFDADEMVDLSAYSLDQRKLWASHVRSLHEHRTRLYGGRVVLIRSRSHQLYCSFEDDYGWAEFAAGGVDVRISPGAHESILEEPHVRNVAEEVGACLARLSSVENLQVRL